MHSVGFGKWLAPLVAPIAAFGVAPMMARLRGAQGESTDGAEGSANADATDNRVPLKKRLHQSSAWTSHAVVIGLAAQGVWLNVHAAPDRASTERANVLDSVSRSEPLSANADSRDAPPVRVVAARVVPTIKFDPQSNDDAPDAQRAPVETGAIAVARVASQTTSRTKRHAKPASSARDTSPRVPPVSREMPRPIDLADQRSDVPARNAFPVEHLPLPKHMTRDASEAKTSGGDMVRVSKSGEPAADLADRSLVAVARDTIGISRKRQAYLVVPSWSPDQITDERAKCDALLKSRNITYSAVPPIKEGSCGAPAPVQVSRFGSSKVDVYPAATMTCTMVAAIDDWLRDDVQPAATKSFGAPVVRLVSASSYSCRNRYGRTDTKISEHALVNALDLSGFRLADGRTVRVLDGWGPTARDPKPEPKKDEPDGKTAKVAVAIAVMPPARLTRAGLSKLGATDIAKSRGAVDAAKEGETSVAAKSDTAAPVKDAKTLKRERVERERRERAMAQASFLRTVHRDACEHFGTVLGPEANNAHRDHFHFDMKLRRHRAYCQ